MISNKCPNCGAPLPHMVQGVDYSCSYCGSAVIPPAMPRFIANTLDKITGAPIVAAKPVYAPDRYAVVAGVKVLLLMISTFTVGALLPPLGIIMVVGSIVSIFKAVYWIVKWRLKVKAQANYSNEQIAEDKRAIELYFSEQNREGAIAITWLWRAGICALVAIITIGIVYAIGLESKARYLGPVTAISIIAAILCICVAWMKALAWAKDPKEEEVSI